MYRTFYNFNILTLLKNRLQLGHHENSLNLNLSSHLFGIRHNIAIFNIHSLWKPYRYLFYNLVVTFSKRSSFFIVATNSTLPMTPFLENLINQYPFKIKEQSYYISGFVDQKWVGGLFTNWKIFSEFIQYIDVPNLKFKKRYRFEKYLYHLKGIKNLWQMPISDFAVVLNNDVDALYELNHFQIPLIGIVDSDMNPQHFLYPFIGNNDSLENLEFFFEFLKEAAKEGRLKEQENFLHVLSLKIKKKLKKKVFFNEKT